MPQFGLEPNVYYIPPVNVPEPFLLQLFGPGAIRAVETYLKARSGDAELGSLINLFGCTTSVIPRFKVKGAEVSAIGDKGEKLVTVPVREPVITRRAYDSKHGVPRMNVN